MNQSRPYTDLPTREIYPRLLRYTLHYWHMFLASLVGMALFAGFSTGIAYILKPLLDGSMIRQDPTVMFWIPFVIVGLFVGRGICNFVLQYCMAWVGTRVVMDVRSDIFAQYLRLPMAYFERHATTHVTTKLIYHTTQIAQSATNALTVTFKDGLTVIGLVGLMFYFNYQLALIIFAITPVLILLINYISRRFRSYSKRIQSLMSDLTQISEEVLTGRRVVKIFGGEAYETQQFERINSKNQRIGMRRATTNAASTPVTQTIAAIGIGVVVYFAINDASMTPGEFAAFFGAMAAVMSPLKRLTKVVAIIQQGMAAAGDIFELLDVPGEDEGGDLVVDRLRGDIAFGGIGFSYQKSRHPALQDVNVRLSSGATVAFVGRSGAGKSTLLTLLPRFYDPTAGTITIDGHDLRAYDLRFLRSQISVVDQNVVLFNDSIARNIAYGTMQKADHAQIEAVAKNAYAWDFIADLPDGLDTQVGQNGLALSGGQRQRIAIARSLLKDAPVLILDEATSALDTESERAIQKALDNLMRDRTTLVIAHRLSTIQGADHIVVLDEGRVVEQGKHDDLMAANGHYRRLHDMQFAEPD